MACAATWPQVLSAAMDHIVVRGPTRVRPRQKTQQAGIHQPGVALAQCLGVNAQRGQFLGPHAVHEDIGRIHQRLQGLLGCGLLEVEHQAFLAAVGPHEHGGHARLQPGAGVAGRIAFGRFDLDDLCAVVGQHLAGQGAKDHAGQVQDPDALKGLHKK